MISKPEFIKPKSIPPAPENNDTTFVDIFVSEEDDSIVTNVLYRIPSYVQNYNSQDNIFEKNIYEINNKNN